jgi:hypothetical protein
MAFAGHGLDGDRCTDGTALPTVRKGVDLFEAGGWPAIKPRQPVAASRAMAGC